MKLDIRRPVQTAKRKLNPLIFRGFFGFMRVGYHYPNNPFTPFETASSPYLT